LKLAASRFGRWLHLAHHQKRRSSGQRRNFTAYSPENRHSSLDRRFRNGVSVSAPPPCAWPSKLTPGSAGAVFWRFNAENFVGLGFALALHCGDSKKWCAKLRALSSVRVLVLNLASANIRFT
jgi:hypothetical protein